MRCGRGSVRSWAQESFVGRADSHRVDHQLVALGCDERDDFEHVGCAVGAEQEPPVRFLADVLGGKRMVDGVEDVLVGKGAYVTARFEGPARIVRAKTERPQARSSPAGQSGFCAGSSAHAARGWPRSSARSVRKEPANCERGCTAGSPRMTFHGGELRSVERTARRTEPSGRVGRCSLVEVMWRG